MKAAHVYRRSCPLQPYYSIECCTVHPELLFYFWEAVGLIKTAKGYAGYLTEGVFDSTSSFTLFNPVGCGGGINRFKSRWEEFCCEISTTHAHIYHNQRISQRLNNRLFLSLFPRANLTYAWCRFRANNTLIYNEVVAVWSFSLAVLIKWIPYGTSNTIYGTPSHALYFRWLNCLWREI